MKLSYILCVSILLCHSAIAAEIKPLPLNQRIQHMSLPGMCSIEPGRSWENGIVTGNGIMGASVLGQPYLEKVVFNHERLFRPLMEERPLPPKISGALPEVRRLMREGKSNSALDFWRKEMAKNGHEKIVLTPSYHPAYTMRIERKDSGAVSDYLRSVDFMNGEAVVRYRNREGSWINRTFVSRADDVIVQLFESPENKPFDMGLSLVDQEVKLTVEMAHISTELSDEWLTARCKYKFTSRGYEGTTRVIAEGGHVQKNGDVVNVVNAERVLLLTRITDLDEFDKSTLAEIQAELAVLPADYGQLLVRHDKLHRPAMERMTFHLEESDDRYLSTEELIAKQSLSDEIIPVLLQKMFHMGRYALLSSSGEMPPTLTGIWNGNHQPAWSGDWTLDTNLNQQIASANICALPEALRAYQNLIEEIAPSWEVNARNLYGFRGILSGIRTAGRENYSTHFGKFSGHCWTAGAAWLIYPLYESYLVTGDKKFLQERVLPLMEKNVMFYEDFLTEIDEKGNFLMVPSFSPEHLQMQSMNAVQDIAAAKQAISNLIEVYRELGIHTGKIAGLEAMLKKLPPYLIDSGGVFKEWALPQSKEHYEHRHMSHSYPIWPAHELAFETHPALMQAMRVALEQRLPQDWSGHNFAVRGFCAARTKYPQMVWLNLYRLMRYDFIETNLITRHNPGWAPNTDVLCGLPGLITEGLVYSKPGVIELLPAWPEELPAGSIEGICTRTQAVVNSLNWDLEKKRVGATITSLKDQWITLYIRQGIASIQTDAEIKPAVPEDIARIIHLKAGIPVQVLVNLDQAINDYPVNIPALTKEEGDRQFEARQKK